MVLVGVKGGFLGLGIGCEVSICYEMILKVDNMIVCDGFFEFLIFMIVKSVIVIRIYFFFFGFICIV